MIRKSIKYYFIAILNLIILTILLALWTDELELILNENVRSIEFLKIIGLTALALIGMRIVVSIFRKRNINSTQKRMKISALLTFIICSILYFNYSKNIIENWTSKKVLRKSVLAKIVSNESVYPNGSKADNLTSEEYKEVISMTWFPKVPENAKNISYSYYSDGFLPDYSFSISYDLPLNAEIKTMEFEDEDFYKRREFEIIGDKKRVTYYEGEH